MPQQPPRILIIHPGTLGDVLLALPAIRGVTRRVPGQECVLLARKEIGMLLKEYGVVDQALDLDGPVFHDLLHDSSIRHSGADHILQNCTHVVAWLHDQEKQLSRKLERFGIRHSWIGSPHDRKLQAVHQAARFCEILGVGTNDIGEPDCLLTSHLGVREGCMKKSKANREKGDSKECLVIHPGSGSLHKCLSPERLGSIIHQLAGGKKERKMVMVQGPADETMVSLLNPLIGGVAFGILQDKTLIEVARVLQESHVFLGHDSGVTHLAAALGVPTVALFGPTDPERWAPKGQHVKIVRGPDCQCDAWQTVRQCTEKRCLSHSVEEVVKTVERLFCHENANGPHPEIVSLHDEGSRLPCPISLC